MSQSCRYDIVEVPYVEPSGVTGIALACGENSDVNMLDADMQAHSFGGRLWYHNIEEATRMPAVAQVVANDAVVLEQLQQQQKCRFDKISFICNSSFFMRKNDL